MALPAKLLSNRRRDNPIPGELMPNHALCVEISAHKGNDTWTDRGNRRLAASVTAPTYMGTPVRVSPLCNLLLCQCCLLLSTILLGSRQAQAGTTACSCRIPSAYTSREGREVDIGKKNSTGHDYAAFSIWSGGGRCVSIRAAYAQELSLPLQVSKYNVCARSLSGMLLFLSVPRKNEVWIGCNFELLNGSTQRRHMKICYKQYITGKPVCCLLFGKYQAAPFYRARLQPSCSSAVAAFSHLGTWG